MGGYREAAGLLVARRREPYDRAGEVAMSTRVQREMRRRRPEWKRLMARIDRGAEETSEKQEARRVRREKLAQAGLLPGA